MTHSYPQCSKLDDILKSDSRSREIFEWDLSSFIGLVNDLHKSNKASNQKCEVLYRFDLPCSAEELIERIAPRLPNGWACEIICQAPKVSAAMELSQANESCILIAARRITQSELF